jgi:hypothetical protein
MSKKISAVLGSCVTAVFFLTLLGGGSYSIPFGEVAIAEAGPNVTVAPVPVPYKKGNVWISGSGFKAKQELGIRVMMGGVLSDISFLVKPRPIANEFGAFSSVWKLNREIRRKLLKANTAYTVTIVDEDGNTVATAPLVFDKAKKKKKKKK